MNEDTNHSILPHLFRQEYSKLTAVICRVFGLKNIEIAEDIASETFLKASELWGLHGLPENPAAWLYTVAKNKAKDHLKRHQIFENKIAGQIKKGSDKHYETEIDFSAQTIRDSQLAMIFAVCNPANSKEAQIALALQILCGFSVEEIANAFLTNKETIKKRLFRARENLREQDFKIEQLSNDDIASRLDSVLTTLYLLFNEGYFSRSNDNLIRQDLCSEAMRLTLILAENPLTCRPAVNALLALQCFQASRLQARINNEEAVLYEDQDRDLWNKELIDRGNFYLIQSINENEISKYYMEASIAYWHTTPVDTKKWEHILNIYNQLLQIEYSPVTAMNRAFAYAKVHGHEKAICEATKLNLPANHYYHSLLGYLYTTVDKEKAIEHFKQAITLTSSPVEKKQFLKSISELEQKQ